MDLASFKILLTSAGQEALQVAQSLEPKESDYLIHYQGLAKVYPPSLAQAALETAILRGQASAKFPTASQMYFTREALEQASSHPVSAYRSARYWSFDYLLDLGCSIGGDTINLASQAATLGIDNQPLRLWMARVNAQAVGAAAKTQFVCADLRFPLPVYPHKKTGAFFDPGRRKDGKRVFSVHDYDPPLDIIQDRLPALPALGVKISPGVKISQIEHLDAELEFISLAGDLKEAVLWFGPLKSAARRATILPGPHSLLPDDFQVPLALSEPLGYLIEPDAAILRAGLVAALGRQLGAFQLDPDISYLTSQVEGSGPFARSWQIEDWMPFSIKRLRAYLNERKVGKITVKKRGSPLQPEELIHMLKLQGDAHRVVVLTHLAGDPIVIVCHPH